MAPPTNAASFDSPTPNALVLAAQDCRTHVCAQVERLALSATARADVMCWLARLDKIRADEVAITPATATMPATVMALPETQRGSYRLGSATDPDATYRTHGKAQATLGYNIQIAVSENFVRKIQALPGAQPDGIAIPAVLAAQQAHHGVVPPKFIYDAAAGEGKTRTRVAAVSDEQTQLVALLLRQDQTRTQFTPNDFTLTEDGATHTCPHGVTRDVAYRSHRGEGKTFRFRAAQCRDCPLWSQCRTQPPNSKAMRQVFISDYRNEVEAARRYNQSDAFKADMKQRPRVERIIAALVRYNGARRARRIGTPNADFQEKMCAAAFNLKRCANSSSREIDKSQTHRTAGRCCAPTASRMKEGTQNKRCDKNRFESNARAVTSSICHPTCANQNGPLGLLLHVILNSATLSIGA